MSSTNVASEKGDAQGGHPEHPLHLFVNRQPFNNPPDRRVMPMMTGAQIAGLVDVAADNAIVRRGKDGRGPEIGMTETVRIESGEHFIVTRKFVDGGSSMSPECRARIDRELGLLAEGGQAAALVAGSEEVIVYRDLPTAGGDRGLPTITDAIAPVPAGYPSTIDLAGLPEGSPLLPHVKGGGNCQRVVTADGRRWALVSYHPHSNGGGPPWDPARHGFHTYAGELLAWLAHLS